MISALVGIVAFVFGFASGAVYVFWRSEHAVNEALEAARYREDRADRAINGFAR